MATSYWDEIEQASDDVNVYESYEAFKNSAAKYPAWKIDLLAVHWTQCEIDNGGLMQYFENSTGILAPEAVLGFERIGEQELAEALRRAMSLLGEEYPRDRDQRNERLGGAESEADPFEELDEIFWSRSDAAFAAMDRYAEAHAAT